MAVHSAKRHRVHTEETSPRRATQRGHRSRMARGAHRAAHLDAQDERRRLLVLGGLAMAAPLALAVVIVELVR